MRFGCRELVMVAVAFGLALVMASLGDARLVQVDRPGESLQRCADRWNQMRMDARPTIAIVSARGRCSVTLAYGFPISYRETSTCTMPYKVVSGPPLMCRTLKYAFYCRVNKYGAYACTTHATEPRHGALRGWNATLSGGTLALDHPPRHHPSTPLPSWAAQYPYANGFIHPWDRNGHLRSGLKLEDHYRGTCSGASHVSGASRVAARDAPLRCYGTRVLFDPCFPQVASWTRGRVVAACPVQPGSTTFERFVILGPARA
jgi:hypothetical protein